MYIPKNREVFMFIAWLLLFGSYLDNVVADGFQLSLKVGQ